ncbi:substrate-binding domain-containing protein [uncultured Shewanella sp.]|uniref:substrate-binding domain-containing protein n=1 Tax=Shewanella atlantica TaxID=271099 RepID=UPI00261C4FAC|nr:substrate-binding domain-containing protein [uncultured Shewanella sp.]
MRLSILVLVFTMLPLLSASGKDLKFAVVPKYHSVFFEQSKQGCMEAAAQLTGVECIYRGPETASVRVQDQIISQLIDEGVDGIAVAVTQSKFLAENSIQKARSAGIPIVTYDSDFDAQTLNKYKNIRSSYIGTDNFEFGRALGEQLKKQRPDGGTLIIQTGRPDSPNLNLRIMGIRAALSGKHYTSPPGKMLRNDNGWTEVREPFNNFDQLSRAVKQMESVVQGRRLKADAFIAVGGWPQNDETLYRNMIAPYKTKLERKEVIVVMSDAQEQHLTMLRDRLAHANVGQSPYEMGRQAILALYNIVKHRDYDEFIHTPINLCTRENYSSCTQHKL